MPLLFRKLSQYHISRYFRLGFLLWDIVLLNMAVITPQLIQFHDLHRMEVMEVQTIALLCNMIWIFLLFYKKYDQNIRVERTETILIRTFRLLFMHMSMVAIFIVALKYEEISRLRMLYFYISFFVYLTFFRIFFMTVLKYARSRGYNFKKVVIVGANATGKNMQKILMKNLSYGYHVMGFFDDDPEFQPNSSIILLGKLDEIENYIAKEKVDEMYVALRKDNIAAINSLVEICERNMVRIKFIPAYLKYTKARKVDISFYENIPVFTLRKEALESTFNRLIKKTFDLCFSSMVILFIFPWLFPVLMILIKMESPGPVFFRQKRSGRDNRNFTCLKFRTMQVNNESDVAQATAGDARITKLGAFMRKTSLDELPQFFNVLWGNMSVVGPRPHMLLHTEQYSELINNFLVRHYAKPGITGWAQISGFRGETKELEDMESRVNYDIWYIENWTFVLDLKIIFLTVFNAIRGEKNAY
jgi:undecaprenyl-phosphate galactose phosphotransferase/putative colanic acid biosynthesis UDP-glucose lipid carrier transferase